MVLANIAGAVALLLWGLHMVHTGIVRAFGSDLRKFLNYALRNRISAFLTGLGLTAILQSSTATALMTSSLAAEGLVGLMPALAIVLGANVGTTLIVQLFSFNIFALSPICLVAGIVAFKAGQKNRLQQLGRVLIGFGLMILALHLLIEWLSPIDAAPATRTLLKLVVDEPIFSFLIAAFLTWIAHSSVAIILLVISLAHSQLLTGETALAMVIGANLGSAINPLLEVGKPGDLASRRVPVGNFLNRVVGVVLAFPFLHQISQIAAHANMNTALLASTFHLVFNLVLAILFIIPLTPIANMLSRLLPEKVDPSDPGVPRYLSENALATPSIALADAVRETLRIVDLIETMLEQVMSALLRNDKNAVSFVSQLDDVVDRLERSVRLYMTRLTRANLAEHEMSRAAEIMSFAINLEHIGDIIDKSLREIGVKKIKRNANFSNEGAQEIQGFYDQIIKSLKLSVSVFVTGDTEALRLLLLEKTEIRSSERTATFNHLTRLREGRSETLETMSMHVDALRDLKRIHSHICAVAYFQNERNRREFEGIERGFTAGESFPAIVNTGS
ncbi:MAG: Na/Pi cotransporter family protein [Afipia felis]|nr:Na/Pi cotransporter family protein [Afipia felis]